MADHRTPGNAGQAGTGPGRARRDSAHAAHAPHPRVIDAAPAQFGGTPEAAHLPLPPHLVRLVAELAPAEGPDGKKSRLLIANLAHCSLFTLSRRPGDDTAAGFEVRAHLASAVPGLAPVVTVQGACAALVWQVADMLAAGQHQQAARWARAAHHQIQK